MAEEPQAPPESVNEADEEREQVYPFFDATGEAGQAVRVRAGWVNEENEVASLVLDYSGPVGSAQDAISAAFTWYVERLREQAQARAEEAQ